MKIGHFIPAYRRQVDPAVWAMGIREAQDCARNGIDVDAGWLDCNGVDMSRNKIIESALAAGLQFVLMQDADCWTDSTGAVRHMIDVAINEGAAAVGAGIGLRREGLELNVHPLKQNAVYECEAVGTGLMLVAVDALALIRDAGHDGPFFARTYKDKAETELMRGGDPYFCGVLRSHGLKVFATTMLTTRHAYTDDQRLTYLPTVEGNDGQATRGRNSGGELDAKLPGLESATQ